MTAYSHASDTSRDAAHLMQCLLQTLDAAKAGHLPTVREIEQLMHVASRTAAHAAMTVYAVGRAEMHAERRAPERIRVGAMLPTLPPFDGVEDAQMAAASRVTVTAPVRAPVARTTRQEALDAEVSELWGGLPT